MICLNAVIENGNNNAFSCIPFLPCWCYIHVETIFGAAILQTKSKRKRKNDIVSMRRRTKKKHELLYIEEEKKNKRKKRRRNESNQMTLIIRCAMNCWNSTLYKHAHAHAQLRRCMWWEMENKRASSYANANSLCLAFSVYMYRWHLFHYDSTSMLSTNARIISAVIASHRRQQKRIEIVCNFSFNAWEFAHKSWHFQINQFLISFVHYYFYAPLNPSMYRVVWGGHTRTKKNSINVSSAVHIERNNTCVEGACQLWIICPLPLIHYWLRRNAFINVIMLSSKSSIFPTHFSPCSIDHGKLKCVCSVAFISIWRT